MSRLVERGLRRQRAIQQARGTAWSLFIIMLPIALLALTSLLVSVAQGRAFSFRVLVSGLIAISAIWLAGQLFREAKRLGNLLKDPGLIMRAEHGPDLAGGMRWSRLNPFSRRRDQQGRS